MKLNNIHQSKTIDFYSANTDSELLIPYFPEGISAGFPSPAADFMDHSLDMNKELIENPASTFYGRVKGDSMRGAGIFDSDTMIIDKSLDVCDKDIVVCYIDGDFTVKEIKIENDACWLIPYNDKYKPIKVTKENDFIVWGVVTHTIRKHRQGNRKRAL